MPLKNVRDNAWQPHKLNIHDGNWANPLIVMTQPTNILFLCTGNSCRSQMAEAWARELGGERFEVQSAGIEAHGKNPNAIEVMREAGIDISGQESTILSEQMLGKADVVVTVCGHADEMCPALLPTVRRVHWPLSDPARAAGTHEKIMGQFRATRDEIEERVRTLISQLKQELTDEPAM
jgi:arsenate reductase